MSLAETGEFAPAPSVRCTRVPVLAEWADRNVRSNETQNETQNETRNETQNETPNETPNETNETIAPFPRGCEEALASAAKRVRLFAPRSLIAGAPRCDLERCLGVYTRRRARVNGRWVYERDGDPWTMMWFAGGFWHVGERRHVGEQVACPAAAHAAESPP